MLQNIIKNLKKRNVPSELGILALTFALLFPLIAGAQQLAPASNLHSYYFRTIVQPGTIIDGHSFTEGATISSVALSDRGEAVFTAYSNGQAPGNAIFTSRRVVASKGDIIEGKILVLIPTDSDLSINNSGQVAYEAWYAETREIAEGGEASGLGVFVEKHLVTTRTFEGGINPTFTLTDNGQLLFTQAVNPAATANRGTLAPTAQRKPSLLDHIRINPPKFPKGSPISIAGDAKAPQRPLPPVAGHGGPVIYDPLSLLSSNRLGQVLIPVNVPHAGFMLLLGTPTFRNSQAR